MSSPQIYDISKNITRNTINNEIILMPTNDYNDISGTISFEIVNSSKNENSNYVIQDNKCYYTPPYNYSGNDSFQYFIFYNDISSNIKNVYINVIGITLTYQNRHIYSYITNENSQRVLNISKEVEIINKNTYYEFDDFDVLYCEYKIKEIGPNAFAKAKNLKEAIFETGIDIIKDSAFYFTNLEKITIYNDVFFLNITSLDIPNNIAVIGDSFNYNTHIYTFDNNDKILLPSTSFTYKNLEQLYLPESLTTIKRSCFRYSKIKNLVIPKNVTLIDFFAFYANEVENLFIPLNIYIKFGSFNKNFLKKYFIYHNETRIVYNGDLDKLVGSNQAFDYSPEVILTSENASLTKEVITIIPKNLFTYSGYLSPSVINFDVEEDTITNLDIRSLANITNVGGSNIEIISQPRGSVIFNDPYFIFTPLENDNITDIFIYEEEYNENIFEQVIVNINYIPINDPPISYDFNVSLNEDDINFQIDLSFNDDSDIINEISYNIITYPINGKLSTIPNNKRSIYYTPNRNFFGNDSFTYNISDSSYISNISTANINILSVNDPPIIYDISETILENSLGFNKKINYLDVDNDISESLVTTYIYEQPINGNVFIENNYINYIPNYGYYGIDSFKYYIFDGDLSSNIANVNVTILERDIPPEVFDIKAETFENLEINIKLENKYLEGNINDVSFIFIKNADYGSFTKISQNNYIYKPNLYYNGFDLIKYYLLAPNGTQSRIATITINIIKTQYANCKICPPKIIFERNNNTYFNKSGKTHSAYKNIRNEGRGKINFISQTPTIIVPPRNKF